MNNETIVYEGENAPSINVLTDGETVWLTQAQMCQLFGRERSVITKHIKNALKEGEVSNESNVQNLHIAKSDKPVKFYDLDVIISVGYRVKSLQGTLFRRWATRRPRAPRSPLCPIRKSSSTATALSGRFFRTACVSSPSSMAA